VFEKETTSSRAKDENYSIKMNNDHHKRDDFTGGDEWYSSL
jgi:hypothetical protein